MAGLVVGLGTDNPGDLAPCHRSLARPSGLLADPRHVSRFRRHRWQAGTGTPGSPGILPQLNSAGPSGRKGHEPGLIKGLGQVPQGSSLGWIPVGPSGRIRVSSTGVAVGLKGRRRRAQGESLGTRFSMVHTSSSRRSPVSARSSYLAMGRIGSPAGGCGVHRLSNRKPGDVIGNEAGRRRFKGPHDTIVGGLDRVTSDGFPGPGGGSLPLSLHVGMVAQAGAARSSTIGTRGLLPSPFFLARSILLSFCRSSCSLSAW